MKTLLTIGIITLLFSSLFQVIWFYYRTRPKKKSERSEESFENLKNEKCNCTSPCTEYCRFNIKQFKDE